MDIDKIINDIISEILKYIKPTKEEYEKLLGIYEFVRDRIAKCIEGHFAEITLQGSVAKDTFIRGESDIDIFVLFNPTKYEDKWFEENFLPKIVNCFKEFKSIIQYAAHPYITLYVDGVEVNIVPAYKVSSPQQIKSAVDRTPFHTSYINSKLSERQKDEVRVFKYLLKSWNIYGAEIETRGFSGYLTELLIVAYGSLSELLKAATTWIPFKTCIDIEKYYPSTRDCLRKFRRSVFIVVDPVDKERNVAAAVSLKSFSIFKLLASAFLRKPTIELFSSAPRETLDTQELVNLVNKRSEDINSCILGIEYEVLNKVPDIVWGQLRRAERVLRNVLKSYGEKYIYIDTWLSKDLQKAIIFIEILGCKNKYHLHIGPPAYETINALNFIIKNSDAIVGPWIEENGRLYCLRRKRYDYATIIRNALENINLTALKMTKIISDDELDLLPLNDNEFRVWFTEFLMRKKISKLGKIPILKL
ncbi:CCA-adding enzyme [Ignisphaera aggregans DSM 17230]|uniref:CCA-adding enzyme n=1 Tax=Ignisphaera aggregans (strain DSM 17230 / JCM 13409 / AQ1.S1) TaxID=583356 RepID=E0SQW4_IGNAA|nr:CCA-adding enzyme [Ignisphaera aggregans DSM 17230]